MNNDSSLENNDFCVKLVSNVSILCKSLLSSLSDSFTYPPDLHVLVNSALLTGSFSDVSVAKHIQSTNNPSTPKDILGFRARLCPDALSICRIFQKKMRRFFQYKPDIHAVANALLATGSFDAKAITNNIFQSYSAVDIDAIASLPEDSSSSD